MLNLFLIAAAAFAALGMVSLIFAPNKSPSPAQPTPPAGAGLKLVAKKPQPGADSSEIDKIRKFLIARDNLADLGHSVEDLEAMAEKQWKNLLLRKAVTSEA